MSPPPPNDRKTSPGGSSPTLTGPAPGVQPQPGKPETWSGERKDINTRVLINRLGAQLNAAVTTIDNRVEYVVAEVDGRTKARLEGYVKNKVLIGILGAAAVVIIGATWALVRDGKADAKEAAVAQVEVLREQLKLQAKAFGDLADQVHGAQVDIREVYKADRTHQPSRRLERDPPPPVELSPWPATESPR